MSTKPTTVAVFHAQMEGLWNYLVTQDRTKSGHRVRALIIDALRTLGYKLRGFKTDRKHLRLHTDAVRTNIYTNIIPDPTQYATRVVEADMNEYLEGDVLAAIPLDAKLANDEYLSAQWQRFHRYQGFCAVENQMGVNAHGQVPSNLRPLRCIPVPEGPDSLWHAVSYWRGGADIAWDGGARRGASRHLPALDSQGPHLDLLYANHPKRPSEPSMAGLLAAAAEVHRGGRRVRPAEHGPLDPRIAGPGEAGLSRVVGWRIVEGAARRDAMGHFRLLWHTGHCVLPQPNLLPPQPATGGRWCPPAERRQNLRVGSLYLAGTNAGSGAPAGESTRGPHHTAAARRLAASE